MNPELLKIAADWGTAGIVIVVVAYFLRYIKTRDVDHKEFTSSIFTRQETLADKHAEWEKDLLKDHRDWQEKRTDKFQVWQEKRDDDLAKTMQAHMDQSIKLAEHSGKMGDLVDRLKSIYNPRRG